MVEKVSSREGTIWEAELSPGKMTQLLLSPDEPVLLDNPTTLFCLKLCFFVYVSIHLFRHAFTQSTNIYQVESLF